MDAKNQYLTVLQEKYFIAKSKKEKSSILNEYCGNTHQNRKYDVPKTPHRRLMESGQISEETKKELLSVYQSLNPAELKRKIDKKLKKLYEIYEEKNGRGKISLSKSKHLA